VTARLLTLPAGRGAKWVALGAGILVAGGLGSLAGKLADVQDETQRSGLPTGSESVRVAEAVDRFPGAGRTTAIVVYRREGGLTAADRAAIARHRAALDGASEPRVSDRDDAALLAVALPEGVEDDDDALADAVDEIRATTRDVPAGLATKVTGSAAFAADVRELFATADATLLVGAALLVLVLLVLIYRSPIFWLLPLGAVLLAEGAVRGLTYLLGSAGLTVSPQSAGICSILVFGAGTDYALLIVARYREELHREEDTHLAMRRALASAGPVVVASGLTVALVVLTLLLSDVPATAGLGPIAAIGIGTAMLAMLTILPAALLAVGRGAFWPFVPRVGPAADPSVRGGWRRLGERVARRPRLVWTAVAALLVVLALPVLRLDTTLSPSDLFRDPVESVEGQELLARSFPAGASVGSTVFLPGADRERAERVAERLPAEGGGLVVGARVTAVGPPGALVEVTTGDDPFSQEAIDDVPALRAAAVRAGGPGTLLGGPAAEDYDQREAAKHDTHVVVPLSLALVLVILVALLRALTAPLLLVATVVLSFAAALGAGALVFDPLFGVDGVDPSLPLIAFVFLVALGVDYNIFLMARVHEEARRHGVGEGMLRGLAVTGAVITSAGIVLAGTFSILALLPVVALLQLGFVIAVGVLADTFLVRSLLVPALAFDLGRRLWWPGRLAR
jgi:RND superfamily putative drug exporter